MDTTDLVAGCPVPFNAVGGVCSSVESSRRDKSYYQGNNSYKALDSGVHGVSPVSCVAVVINFNTVTRNCQPSSET